MSRPFAFESAYQSVLTYMSPNTRRVLDREIAAIEQNVSREVDKFGEQLGAYVEQVTKRTIQELKAEAATSRAKLDSAIAKLEKATEGSEDDLSKEVSALKKQLTDYEDKWTKAGKTLRKSVISAVSTATGLPLGNLSKLG